VNPASRNARNQAEYIAAGLDTSQPFVRDLKKKQEVTSASLEKIEKSS
jgi:hypothetical protein